MFFIHLTLIGQMYHLYSEVIAKPKSNKVSSKKSVTNFRYFLLCNDNHYSDRFVWYVTDQIFDFTGFWL